MNSTSGASAKNGDVQPDGGHEGPGLEEGLADMEAAGIRLRVGPSGRLQVPKGFDVACEAAGFDAAFVRAWLGENNDPLVALLRAREGADRLDAAVAAVEEDHAAGVAERADIMLVEALTECGVDPNVTVTSDEAADQVVDIAAIREAAQESFEHACVERTAGQCQALWDDHRGFWELAMGPHAHELTQDEVDRVMDIEADIETAIAAANYARTARLIRAWQEATTPRSLRARVARGEAA